MALDLGKQVGPLPLGGWIVVVAGGLGIGYFINRNMANKTNGEIPLTEPGVGTGGGTFLPVNPPTETPTQEDDTNQKWGVRVVNWMVANGYDPTVADLAVRRYLSGQRLSPQEQAIINLAITQFKMPPEPLPGPEPDVKPQPVSNLVVTSVTDRRIGIAWSPVMGAEYYEVVASSAGGTWGAQKTVIPSWINMSEFGTNMDHTLTVWAINDYGRSEPRAITAKTKRLGETGSAPPSNTPSLPPSTPPPSSGPRQYTIVAGDMLTSISLRYYGSANRWREIYNASSGAIEAAARDHGKSSSRGGPNNEVGWYIFPGTVITIP